MKKAAVWIGIAAAVVWGGVAVLMSINNHGERIQESAQIAQWVNDSPINRCATDDMTWSEAMQAPKRKATVNTWTGNVDYTCEEEAQPARNADGSIMTVGDVRAASDYEAQRQADWADAWAEYDARQAAD